MACAVLIALIAPACDVKTEMEIRADYKACMQALAAGDGEAAANLTAQADLDDYGRLAKAVREGTRAELQSLTPYNRFMAIYLRHTLSAQELKGMDGRAFLVYLTNEGFFESAVWDDLGEVNIYKGYATGVLLDEDDRPTNYKFEFIPEGGRWKTSSLPTALYYDHMIQNEAAAAERDLNKYIEFLIARATGEAVRPDIWDKPTR